MPSLYETIDELKQLSTQELLKVIKDLTGELSDREIPTDYDRTELRGGTRPTHQPLNP